MRPTENYSRARSSEIISSRCTRGSPIASTDKETPGTTYTLPSFTRRPLPFFGRNFLWVEMADGIEEEDCYDAFHRRAP